MMLASTLCCNGYICWWAPLLLVKLTSEITAATNRWFVVLLTPPAILWECPWMHMPDASPNQHHEQ
jgi:hypothetical protein